MSWSKSSKFQQVEALIKDVLAIENAFRTSCLNDISFHLRSKIAYVLWTYPATRESYIALKIKYYELFHPSIVNDDGRVALESFFQVPKMYDIQRHAAHLQNTLEWCSPSARIKHGREQRQDQEESYYSSIQPVRNTQEWSLFLDETGKTEAFFVVGGIVFFDDIVRQSVLTELHEFQQNREYKFREITPSNVQAYKNLISRLFEFFPRLQFAAVILNNQGLDSQAKRTKTLECTNILLRQFLHSSFKDVASTGSTIEMSVNSDIDGTLPDAIRREEITSTCNAMLTNTYGSFCQLSSYDWHDSNNYLEIQISDLFVGSLNFFLCQKPTDTPNALAKNDFARHFLNLLGITTLQIDQLPDQGNLRLFYLQ